MEQTIPIEECARQRLQVMVYAFTMFTKNLMEAGVNRDKVKNASDKVWTVLGEQAAGQGFALPAGSIFNNLPTIRVRIQPVG